MRLTRLPNISNCHIPPAILYSNEAINQFHFLVMCAHYIFYNFSQVIFYYMLKNFIFALQIDFIFPMCVCVLSKIKISHSNIIPIYYCGAAQDRRGGLNRLWVYLAQDRRKLGSNRLRRRDIAMMQSALTACASQTIQTSYQLTVTHHFTMEKCVNVHKSPMENVMM